MIASERRVAHCVMDGMSLTLTFYPDIQLVRICNADGRCLREMLWHDSWTQLVGTLRSVMSGIDDAAPAFQAARPVKAARAAAFAAI